MDTKVAYPDYTYNNTYLDTLYKEVRLCTSKRLILLQSFIYIFFSSQVSIFTERLLEKFVDSYPSGL